MNKCFFIVIAVIISVKAFGQNTKADSSFKKNDIEKYHNNPVWIDMMNDPNVNYYEACKAFDIFWQGREIPSESEGEAAELYKKNEEEDKGLKFKNPETYKYIYSYKQFINWRRAMANKVDPQTGQLLTNQQQLNIWKEQTMGVNTNIR
jgi:hypothetical protein